MAKIIGLPKLSPTMEEGTLVRWVKQEGDTLEVDDQPYGAGPRAC